MKYGGDKIKIVTDDLKKGDNLQALAFDTCGYMLIGKWDDGYGTQGDPLVSNEVPCGSEGNCPICQEKITDITDLPGRPEPCSSGDAFIMMTNTGKLKTLCKANFEDKDENVKTSSGDGTPGYLYDKIKVCDSSGPLSIKEISSGNNHHLCIGFDATKVGMDIVDLDDGPGAYPSNKGLLVGSSSGWDRLEPNICSKKDYSYVVYNKNSQAFTTICEKDTSIATWRLESDYQFECAFDITKDILIKNGNTSHIFKSTDDIDKGTGDDLMIINRPGVYILSMNITISNLTKAGLTAIRAGLTINGEELGDAKYDSRSGSQYMNEEYPNQLISHEGMAREMDLQIMSFDTTYSWVIDESAIPAKVRLHVKPDTRVSGEIRHTSSSLGSVQFLLTAGSSETGGKAFVSAVRIGDVPGTYTQR